MTADKDTKTDAREPPAGGRAGATVKRPTAKEARAARLAGELRANLKRRKASQRERGAAATAAPGKGGMDSTEDAAKMPPEEPS